MELITNYIMQNSNGRKHPVCSYKIAADLHVTGIDVRHMVNEARRNGDPICSCGRGYYVTTDAEEIQKTIDSIQSRIAGMKSAIAGLEKFLERGGAYG